ncbi:MAG: LuxR C-terminal-related transcriptional regulator [Phycisphaerales bacterium]
MDAVATNPFVGIAVLCGSGRFIYLNDWVARAMKGPGGTAREIVGRTLHDEFQSSWADERLAAVREVMLSGRPLLVRILWEGVQFMTWFRALTPRDIEPGRGAVIAMAHRVAGDAREFLAPGAEEYLESSTVRLGPLNKLTTPELRVLALLGRGLSVREVAKQLFRAEKTIEFHRTSIHRKLNIADRVELACIAQRAGLTLEDADRPRI